MMVHKPTNPYQAPVTVEPHPKRHGLIAQTIKFALTILPSFFLCVAIVFVLFRGPDQPEATRHLLILVGIGLAIPLAIFLSSRGTWKSFISWCVYTFVGGYLIGVVLRVLREAWDFLMGY